METKCIMGSVEAGQNGRNLFLLVSRNCHRPIKAPFLSFSFFFVIMGPNGPLLVKRYGSASFEACLFVASRYDSPNPCRNVPLGYIGVCHSGGTFLLSLLFCTPLCYCEVWSVYSDSVVLLQGCVGEGRVLSLDDRHL